MMNCLSSNFDKGILLMSILRSALTLSVFLSYIKKIDMNKINAVSRIQFNE